MEGAVPETGRTCYELTWLSRLLARHTSESLRSNGADEQLDEAWHGEPKDVDVLHNYDHCDFGGELVLRTSVS